MPHYIEKFLDHYLTAYAMLTKYLLLKMMFMLLIIKGYEELIREN